LAKWVIKFIYLSYKEIVIRGYLIKDKKRKKPKKAIPKDIPIIWVNIVEPYEG
jgi:hypothetical protein